MTWILHISDLHLGEVSPGQALDDHKVIVPQEDLETTQRVFRRTLASLKEYVDRLGTPAALVVSGDLSYRAKRDGFDAFIALLDEHAGLLPARDHIVVVPGNHDVEWDAEPGTSLRYELFLEATRAAGCATPLLDGVDFNTVGDTTLSPDAVDIPHVVDHPDFVIIPLNSSNWCGTVTQIAGGWNSETWLEKLEPLGDGRDEALEQLTWVRQQDMPRVSQAQIDALRQLFELKRLQIDRGGDPRPRIAVLHHQLLPVSTRVEMKPFESLVNLGLVRETLSNFGIDVVLHGHKHESGIYWDFARRARDPIMLERRTLVVASPGNFQPHMPVMRALELRGSPRARNVRIVTFNGVDGASATPEVGPEVTLPLWLGQMETESMERTTLRGRTVHETYARLCGHFELSSATSLSNVVCEIADASDSEHLPDDYPDTGATDRQRWFGDLVEWWQLSQSRLVREGVLPFNHGERIRSRWGDQVDRAARLLNERGHSSRGLVLLVDPDETGRRESDPRPLDRGTYPAFVLAEFSLSERAGRKELDCFGYFRKQEMRYWWPVNVAELGRLQREVLTKLDQALGVRAGRIVTFSAIALYGTDVPSVAVTALDRATEVEAKLWDLAAAVALSNDADPEASRLEWQRILNELSGEGRQAPPVPALGHLVLLDALNVFVARADPGSPATRVKEELERLCGIYRALPDPPLGEAQRALVLPAVQGLRDAVEEALSDGGS